MGCVYLITSPSGKQYVGKTIQPLEARWTAHVRDAGKGSGFALHRAIRKYGADAFTHEILHESDDEDELFELEIAMIDELGTLLPLGYNMTFGGDGIRLTPEKEKHRREKVAEAVQSPQFRSAQSARSKEMWADPEFHAMMSAASKERQNDPEYREWRSSASKEMWAEPGFSERRAEAMAAAWADHCWGDKLSEAGIRNHEDEDWSNEHRERVRTARQRPEAREATSQSVRERFADDDYRAEWNLRNGASKILTDDGRVFNSVVDAALELGVGRNVIYYRLNKGRYKRLTESKGTLASRSIRFFVDGKVFDSMREVSRTFGISDRTVRIRDNSQVSRFRFWTPLVTHNDPIHDELEAVVAILQFAKANPDHENVPQWAHDYLCGLDPDWGDQAPHARSTRRSARLGRVSDFERATETRGSTLTHHSSS